SFIIRNYQPHTIMIGYDHRFGLNRAGNINTLITYQDKGHFKVFELPQKKIDALKISSTLIRRALENHQIRDACKMLGYPYRLSGQVIHGEKLGGKLGFKTANIQVDDAEKLIPANGIYAVLVRVRQEVYRGMLYIGTKPSVSTSDRVSIEVHLFDFNQDIYHEELDIELIAFIRNDATFDTLEELKHRIRSDQELTMELLDGEKAQIQS